MYSYMVHQPYAMEILPHLPPFLKKKIYLHLSSLLIALALSIFNCDRWQPYAACAGFVTCVETLGALGGKVMKWSLQQDSNYNVRIKEKKYRNGLVIKKKERLTDFPATKCIWHDLAKGSKDFNSLISLWPFQALPNTCSI
ncbi:hypothetical protein XENTR_v10007937 [Xenopus tropicalis]|nr:hypothetical protein XENTR_v10007937 [Xenopus tropicalis]